MKRGFLAILLALSLGLCAGNPEPGGPALPDKTYLGFSLMPGPNSALVTYKIIKVYSGGPQVRYEQENISRHDFLSIAMGLVPSEANPKQENLFVKYEIQDCFFQHDTVLHRIKYDFAMQCPVIDDIWRLRWGEYPLERRQGADDPGPGWAQDKLGISEGQFNILRGYGMNNSYNDPIFGDKAFQLLHDMQDAAWQSRYRGS